MVGSRVYVGGLNNRVRVKDLERFFRKYRKLRDIVIKNGFGFVEFDDERDASDAVYEMNGRELLGSRVSVEKARSTPHAWWMKSDSGRRGGSSKKSRYGTSSRTQYRLSVSNLSTKVSWQGIEDQSTTSGRIRAPRLPLGISVFKWTSAEYMVY